MEAPARLIPLSGAFNFRDLGGYPGLDGRHTRWGRLFRSDTLHELTAADVEVLRSFGLVTVIDLRTAREVTRTGRGLLEPEPVNYRHLSVIVEEDGEAVAMPATTDDDLAERYRWYLDVGRDALVASLDLLGDPANLPLVFHCAAGKDRTGVLAALVLDILGVERSVIVADYEITAERMELILDRYRSDPKVAARMADAPASRFGVEAVTMERFLARLYADFGGAREWALESGVGAGAIANMRDHLLEPSR